MDELRPAGFWIRVAAALVDFVVFMLVQASLRGVAAFALGVDVDDSSVAQSAVVLFTFVFTGLYTTLLHALGGQTLGKLVFGVRVVMMDGDRPTIGVTLLRYFAYYASLVPVGLGFVMAGLRRDRRALHDLIAGTRVERIRRAAAVPEPVELGAREPTLPPAAE